MSADPEAGHASDHNLSTEHQPKGSARNPSDTLDRNATQNATVRRGGEAAGGVAPKAGDPTSPAEADARAAERDRAQREQGLGNDAPATEEG